MKQRKGGWTTVWDDDQKVPYTYKDQEWIGYDNQASVKIKAEYAKSKGLGGVLVGSIDRDDVNNYCGEGKYPLMRAIKEVLLPHTKSEKNNAKTSGKTRLRQHYQEGSTVSVSQLI